MRTRPLVRLFARRAGGRRGGAGFVAAVSLTLLPGCGSYLTLPCEEHPSRIPWRLHVLGGSLVEDTIQLRVGETAGLGLLGNGLERCDGVDPVASVSWVLTNASVGTITPAGSSPSTASFKGLAPGETGIVARITFNNGERFEASRFWLPTSAPLRDALRVVP